MRKRYCGEASSFHVHLKLRQIAAVIAVAGGAMLLMQFPAGAEAQYCTNLGVQAATACKDRPPPPGATYLQQLSYRLNRDDRCIGEGRAARDACQAKPWMVTASLYSRCDQQFCWAILDTVSSGKVCAKTPKNVRIGPGRVLPGDVPLPLENCGEEMNSQFESGATGEGPEFLPVVPIVALSCLIGDPVRDAPRWSEGFCYGIFRMGDREVCGKAKKERVPPNRSVDRPFLNTLNFSDCPQTVLHSYHLREQDRIPPRSNNRLPPVSKGTVPVPRGTSPNSESTVTGETYEHDPGGLFPVAPQYSSPHQAPAANPNITPQRTTPSGSPAGQNPKGKSANPGSTITDRTTGNPGSVSSRPAGPSSPTSQANGGAPAQGHPGPGGVKIDVAPTGRTSDLSDVRDKVLHLVPKRDAVDGR